MNVLAHWPRQVLLVGYICGIALIDCQAVCAQQSRSPVFPNSLLGSWQVDSVLIDTGATRTFQYQYNDPRLRGRIITIAQNKISSDLPVDKSCEPPVNSRTAALAALIKDTMGERGEPPKSPTPLDYRIGVTGGTNLRVWDLRCGKRNRTWVAVLPDGRLAMRWYDDTILRLTRLSDEVRPGPSFACAKAGTDSEKAICASVSLSAFDRSVGEAYAAAAKLYRDPADHDDLEKLRVQQREWIAKRNSCKADSACLEQSMRDRLEDLASIK